VSVIVVCQRELTVVHALDLIDKSQFRSFFSVKLLRDRLIYFIKLETSPLFDMISGNAECACLYKGFPGVVYPWGRG